MRLSLTSCLLAAALAPQALAQGPDIIHYTFDSGDATNSASGTVGDGTVLPGVTFAPTTVCSTGMSASTDGTSGAGIDSGWAPDLGPNDWTIGFHLGSYDMSTSTQYFFGSASAGGFRCFSGGVATATGIMLRTTMGTDVLVPGAHPGTGASHLVFVFDAAVPEVRAYLDGALAVTEMQPNVGTGVVGGSPDFEVLTYFGSVRPANEVDDFRIYRRALTQTEIAAWANCGGTGPPTFCDPNSPNSTGMPTVMTGATGSGVGSGLHLDASQGPPSQFGYFLVGTAVSDPGIMIPNSNGFLCLTLGGGNSLGRYNVGGSQFNSLGQFDASGVLQNQVGTSTSGTGYDVPTTVPIAGSPQIMTGETWHFQLWHRESGGLSNFSNGLSVTF